MLAADLGCLAEDCIEAQSCISGIIRDIVTQERSQSEIEESFWSAATSAVVYLQVHPKAQEQDSNRVSLDLGTVFEKLVTRKR